MTSAWDQVADEFVEKIAHLQATVRSHNLYQQLIRHLSPGASIVDIGGGDGRQSIPLARAGHHVTIVEPSALMLKHAAHRLESESSEVAARVQLIEGPGQSAVEILGARRFEAVLCHAVILYVEDPRPLLSEVCRLASPGALVSIVAKNARALTIMAAHNGRWKEVIDLFEADRVVNNMGVTTRAHTVEELSKILEGFGCTVEAWYGVYYFTQGSSSVPLDTIADDDLTAILAAEFEASQRDPYRQLSNLFHLVARKGTE